jgi:hypothetical protein
VEKDRSLHAKKLALHAKCFADKFCGQSAEMFCWKLVVLYKKIENDWQVE